MKKISDLFSRTSRKRILSQSLFFGAIASVSVISNAFSFSSKAEAQTPPPIVNNTEIDSYAQAVLAMEPARQNAFEEIKKLIGNGEIPQIVCNDSNSINGLPKKAQDIAVNYCNHAQKIVEDNGLRFEQFNKITIELQNNTILKSQVYNTLLRLQQPPESR
ncbi:DUF4168 domain-containing protein [Nostoc sp. 'Lobaria pulmonaria (5183) cyanobiont']|uniref:DUF4168 domain-containing protein n=1 Tax=Nostoc sp. 'Lobaria pulmonaria (5183) cyanobiont' TaxID=1618022 RepID=UPI000CF3629F|nr:DUF4168 domain-containing protein [Nostoc sp. 'Lobaria pulmonaria (5183) cyanobiont']AVH69957.1 protein of unknown function DUF4168 [Nostoc sp. 'Lobaria pulmonaria (5183) cyanobiont']